MTIAQIVLASAASSYIPTPPVDNGTYIWDGRDYVTNDVFPSSSSTLYPMTTAGGWSGPDLAVANGPWGGTVNSYWMNFANEGASYHYGYTTPGLNDRGYWRTGRSDNSFTVQFWFYIADGHIGSVLCGLTDQSVSKYPPIPSSHSTPPFSLGTSTA